MIQMKANKGNSNKLEKQKRKRLLKQPKWLVVLRLRRAKHRAEQLMSQQRVFVRAVVRGVRRLLKEAILHGYKQLRLRFSGLLVEKPEGSQSAPSNKRMLLGVLLHSLALTTMAAAGIYWLSKVSFAIGLSVTVLALPIGFVVLRVIQLGSRYPGFLPRVILSDAFKVVMLPGTAKLGFDTAVLFDSIIGILSLLSSGTSGLALRSIFVLVEGKGRFLGVPAFDMQVKALKPGFRLPKPPHMFVPFSVQHRAMVTFKETLYGHKGSQGFLNLTKNSVAIHQATTITMANDPFMKDYIEKQVGPAIKYVRSLPAKGIFVPADVQSSLAEPGKGNVGEVASTGTGLMAEHLTAAEHGEPEDQYIFFGGFGKDEIDNTELQAGDVLAVKKLSSNDIDEELSKGKVRGRSVKLIESDSLQNKLKGSANADVVIVSTNTELQTNVTRQMAHKDWKVPTNVRITSSERLALFEEDDIKRKMDKSDSDHAKRGDYLKSRQKVATHVGVKGVSGMAEQPVNPKLTIVDKKPVVPTAASK